MARRTIPQRERGVALLAVLILVAITGAIAVASLEKLRLSRALAQNVVAIDQARYFAGAAEQLGVLIIDDLVAQDRSKTTLAGGWNGATRRIPMPIDGLVEARLRDGGNCFNINSVVSGSAREGFARRPSGVEQFNWLMVLVGIPAADARRIAEAAADWADSDNVAGPGGAEDEAYAGGPQPYKTSNSLFVDVSELRALAGMRGDYLARLRPFVCALPVSDLSPINLNTLLPNQAILIAMLAPNKLSEQQARRVLALRPAAGWNNPIEFWRNESLSALGIPLDAQQQAQVKTSWFVLDVTSRVGPIDFEQTSLVDARLQPAHVVQRRWQRDEAAPATGAEGE
jgi:general secretion pathway protein K